MYLCRANRGGLAQLVRALAWHARGHEFDSRILHENRGRPSSLSFFVENRCYLSPKPPFCKGGLLWVGVVTRTRDLRSPPFQRRVWEDCKHNPKGVREHPEFDSRILHENRGRPSGLPFFVENTLSLYLLLFRFLQKAEKKADKGSHKPDTKRAS